MIASLHESGHQTLILNPVQMYPLPRPPQGKLAQVPDICVCICRCVCMCISHYQYRMYGDSTIPVILAPSILVLSPFCLVCSRECRNGWRLTKGEQAEPMDSKLATARSLRWEGSSCALRGGYQQRQARNRLTRSRNPMWLVRQYQWLSMAGSELEAETQINRKAGIFDWVLTIMGQSLQRLWVRVLLSYVVLLLSIQLLDSK